MDDKRVAAMRGRADCAYQIPSGGLWAARDVTDLLDALTTAQASSPSTPKPPHGRSAMKGETLWAVIDPDGEPVPETVRPEERHSIAVATLATSWERLESHGYRCRRVKIEVLP